MVCVRNRYLEDGPKIFIQAMLGNRDAIFFELQARLVRRPKRAEVPVTAEVQLVVEYYAAR